MGCISFENLVIFFLNVSPLRKAPIIKYLCLCLDFSSHSKSRFAEITRYGLACRLRLRWNDRGGENVAEPGLT